MGKDGGELSEHFGAEEAQVLYVDFLKRCGEEAGADIAVPNIGRIVVVSIRGVLHPFGFARFQDIFKVVRVHCV